MTIDLSRAWRASTCDTGGLAPYRYHFPANKRREVSVARDYGLGLQNNRAVDGDGRHMQYGDSIAGVELQFDALRFAAG